MVALPLVIVYLPLLFPEGRLPSRRWRIPARVLVVTSLAFVVGAAVPAAGSTVQPDGSASGQASDASRGPVSSIVTVLALTTITAAAAAVFSLVLRFRKSQGTEREQLKWFLFAGSVLGDRVRTGSLRRRRLNSLNDTVIPAFFTLSVLGIPIATGIAILRYRL